MPLKLIQLHIILENNKFRCQASGKISDNQLIDVVLTHYSINSAINHIKLLGGNRMSTVIQFDEVLISAIYLPDYRRKFKFRW